MQIKILDTIEKDIHELIQVFMKEYFPDADVRDYRIIAEDMHWPFQTVCILDDEYWNLSDIYTALKHKIPEATLHNWYSEWLDYAMEHDKYDWFPNLYNYNRQTWTNDQTIDCPQQQEQE